MKIKDVITLKEVSHDLNDGKTFYDQKEAGVGDYFWDSLIADIESLTIYAPDAGKTAPESIMRRRW